MDLSKFRQQAEGANKNLNLNVLQRKDSSIIQIIDTATHVVAYRYNAAHQCWEKRGVEGSFFIYERSEAPRYGFFIMNRISIENIMELVTSNMRFNVSDPYLLYRNPLGEICGIWFYNDEERKRITSFLTTISEQGGTTPSITPQQPSVLSMLHAATSSQQQIHPASPYNMAQPPPRGSPMMGSHSPAQPQMPVRFPALTQHQSRPSSAPQVQPPLSHGGGSYNADATSDLLKVLNKTSTDMQQGISAEERMSQQLQALLLSGRTAPMAMIANEQKQKVAEAEANKPKAADAFLQTAMIPTQARMVRRKKHPSTSENQLLSKEQLRDALINLVQTNDDLMNALYAEYIVQMNNTGE